MTKQLLLATFAIIAVACNKQAPVHDHGPEPLAYTVYSDKSEIFVEFKPLVVGASSKFAAHFTVLGENFTALREGKVTVSLIVDSKGIRQTASAPSVPGIYRLALTPTVAGTGKLVFDIETKTFTDRIIIDSIKVYTDEKSALADQHEDSGVGNDITYLKEQAWKVEFANTPAARKSISNVIKTNGQLLSAPGDEMIVSAKADGIVVFSGSSTVPGAEVNPGTNLFTISGGDITENNIDARYRESKANFDKAKSDYDRATDLVKDKIISQKDYLESKRAFENAQVEYNTIGKNYTAAGQHVNAPMSGFIKNILVTEGQFVSTGTPLAIVSKNKKLILQANVSQKYFNHLPEIKSANFKSANSDVVYSTEQVNGKVISFGKSASANSPFIPVIFEIDNSGNLVPGSIVEVYLKTGSIQNALVIPVSALLEEQGNFFVYVQTEGESYQKREVKLGSSDGLNIQVLNGVSEGERVVSKGAYQIKLSSASGTMPAHGHEH